MRAMIGGGVAGVLIGLFSLEAYTFAEEMMGKGMAVIVTNSNDYIDVIGKESAHADAMQPLLYVM